MGQQKVPPAILTPLRRVASNPSIISYRENVSDRKALRVKECLTGGAHTGKILSAFTDVAPGEWYTDAIKKRRNTE